MAMLCLLGLTGMGEDSPGRTDSGGTTEVSFCYWANYKDNEYLVDVCADFERKNPGIKIRREWYVGDYGRKLQLTLLSDTAADIILMDDEPYPAYAVRGYLEDLRPYILRKSDDIEREFAAELEYMETPEAQRDPNFNRVFYPTALQSFNYRGFQGALPWDGNVVLMFYNKDLFDQAGISYPTRDWTWNEFREIAKKLTKDLNGDGRSEQFGTNMFFELLSFEPLLWSFGGEVLNKEGTRSRIQEPRGIEAAQFMYDIKYKDRSIAYTGEMENFYTEVQLLTGRVGMVPGGSYMIPMLNRVHDAMRWDVADMPIGPHGDRYTRVTWDGISINSHVAQAKKEIAWRFIKHLVSHDAQFLLGSTQRGLPIRHADALQYYVDPNTPAHEEIAIEACDYGKLTPVTPRYLELQDATLDEFDSLNNAEFSGLTPRWPCPGSNRRSTRCSIRNWPTGRREWRPRPGAPRLEVRASRRWGWRCSSYPEFLPA